MKYLILLLFIVQAIFNFNGIANAVPVFFEDFDGGGAGISAWRSEGGIGVCSWDEFDPSAGDPENVTLATGHYASIRVPEFLPEPVFDEYYRFISPIVNVGAYQDLSLSFDMYFYDTGLPEDYFILEVNGRQLEYFKSGEWVWDSHNTQSVVWQVPICGTQRYDIPLLDGETEVEIAFTWWSSSEPFSLGEMQIDNIKLEGAPVPEPATILLICSGVIGLAGIGKKKIFS